MRLIFCLNVSKENVFQNRRAIYRVFFQFIVEKNDRSKLCGNSETLAEEIIF